jgi:co-chaperonin GroES (HSP10)
MTNIKPSRYLEQFKQLKATGNDYYELIGDVLIVEKLAEEERKTASGLVLATGSKQVNALENTKAIFCLVLAVGKGFYDEVSGKEVDLNVQPGDIILIGETSAKYFSFFGSLQNYEPHTIGITREAEVQLRFRGAEGYEKAFKLLNQFAKKEVETRS